LKSNHEGRVDLGALSEVTSVYALGYVFPVSTQFISSTSSEIVVPYVKDGTVFVPANLLPVDLFPQLLCPLNHVVRRNESQIYAVQSLPDAIRSSDKNGAVINVPLPGLYVIRLYCCQGVRDVAMRVIEATAGRKLLSLNEGASCELFEPVVPVDCRISSITCEDKTLVVSVSGSQANFEKMNLSVWFCNCFPLGSTFDGSLSSACEFGVFLRILCFCYLP